MYDQFANQGYLSPLRVLTARECQRFLQAITDAHEHTPPEWHKSLAASSRAFYDIATHETIVETVAALIGKDVMLWGASMQDRPPQAVHAWHSDIESWTESGRMVSVWIGMENTSRESSLRIIPYSYRFDITVQELRHRYGKRREELTDDEILCWAKERDPRSELIGVEMADGEALFFDGRIWHGSRNSSERTRRALLLQYATPDTVIRIPDLNHLDWPFHQLSLPRPPCLMVRGSDTAGVNRIVSPPSEATDAGSPRLTSRVYPLAIPLPADHEKGWKPHFIFNGSTSTLRSLTCHVSVLTQGHCPHPPHR